MSIIDSLPSRAPTSFQRASAGQASAAGPAPNLGDTVDIKSRDVSLRDEDLLALRARQAQFHNTWSPGPGGLLYERNKPNATVAVLDNYGQDPGGNPQHGEITSALAGKATRRGDAAIMRIEDSMVKSLPPMPQADSKNFSKELKQHLVGAYTEPLDTATAALKEIQKKHPNINALNHSQGASGPSLTRHLVERAQDDPAFGKTLAPSLGLPETTNWSDPASVIAAARHVQDTLSKSPEVKQSAQAFQAQLQSSEGKTRYFNSAGNDGRVQDELARHGFAFDPRWAGNGQGQATGTTTVGSGMEAYKPGQKASLPVDYSQRTKVNLLTDGQARVSLDGRPLCRQPGPPGNQACIAPQGTSFAAPRAAGVYSRDPRAFDNLLRNATPPIPGQTGAGVGYVDTVH